MFFIKCGNATFMADRNQNYIICKKTGDRCLFQRYCSQKKNFELCPEAEKCLLNPKNNKDSNSEKIMENIIEPVVQDAQIKENEPKVEEKSNYGKKNKNEKYNKPKIEEVQVEEESLDYKIDDEREFVIEETKEEILEEYLDATQDDTGSLQDVEEIIESEEE